MTQGRIKRAPSVRVEIIDRCVRGPEVIDAVGRNVGSVHGDLNADNVFITDSGYKVIDWQRPILGPMDLNRSFLDDPKIDTQMKKGLLRVETFLFVAWMTEAKKTWIPDGPPADTIAVLAQDIVAGSSKWKKIQFRASPIT